MALDDEERKRLTRLVERHHGNLSSMCRDLAKGREFISRQGLTARLRKYGLVEAACAERARSGVTGPRVHLADGSADPEAERETILQTLALTQTYEHARAELGMSRRTLYRKLSKYEITAEVVETRRQRLRRAKAKPRRRATG